jgi:prepilin-type processing-associated H-X9-DG protein
MTGNSTQCGLIAYFWEYPDIGHNSYINMLPDKTSVAGIKTSMVKKPASKILFGDTAWEKTDSLGLGSWRISYAKNALGMFAPRHANFKGVNITWADAHVSSLHTPVNGRTLTGRNALYQTSPLNKSVYTLGNPWLSNGRFP